MVKRYEIAGEWTGVTGIDVVEMVSASDYDALAARLAATEQERDIAVAGLTVVERRRDELKARLADCELERDVAREMARDKAARLAEAEFDANALRELQTPRPLEAWHEDDGPALWWVFPLVEPPYCGSPLDEDWPGYHTHWTTFTIPDAPAVSASAQPDHCEDHREFDIDCLDCQDALIAAKRAASTVSEVEHGGR